MKQNVPYAVAVLVLGICSIVFSCVLVGLVCGIIGLILAANGIRAYRLDPEQYSGYGMLQAGKIMSIIGIILGGLYIIYMIIFVFLLGLGTLPYLCEF